MFAQETQICPLSWERICGDYMRILYFEDDDILDANFMQIKHLCFLWAQIHSADNAFQFARFGIPLLEASFDTLDIETADGTK